MNFATRRDLLILILLTMTVITLCGCGVSGDVKEDLLSTDTIPPTISSTYPADGATGFAVNSAITATFSEAMDASTINTTTFSLSGGVTGTVTYTGTTATFTPSSNLSFSTTYTATITTGAKDSAGNAMATAYIWSFTLLQPTATLLWDAPSTWADGTTLSENDIGGYKIYYGTSSGNYTNTIDVGKFTTYTFSNLSNGTYYVAVTAYDVNGIESDYSNEVVKVIQ